MRPEKLGNEAALWDRQGDTCYHVFCSEGHHLTLHWLCDDKYSWPEICSCNGLSGNTFSSSQGLQYSTLSFFRKVSLHWYILLIISLIYYLLEPKVSLCAVFHHFHHYTTQSFSIITYSKLFMHYLITFIIYSIYTIRFSEATHFHYSHSRPLIYVLCSGVIANVGVRTTMVLQNDIFTSMLAVVPNDSTTFLPCIPAYHSLDTNMRCFKIFCI